MTLLNLPGTALAFGDFDAPSARVDAPVFPQKPMRNWCWACVGAAILTWRGRPTQPCEVALGEFPGKRCCPQSDADRATDEVRELSDVLPDEIRGHDTWSFMRVDAIQREIAGGRPVVVQYDFGGGTHHYALIVDVVGSGSSATLTLSDPLTGFQAKNVREMGESGAYQLLWVAP